MGGAAVPHGLTTRWPRHAHSKPDHRGRHAGSLARGEHVIAGAPGRLIPGESRPDPGIVPTLREPRGGYPDRSPPTRRVYKGGLGRGVITPSSALANGRTSRLRLPVWDTTKLPVSFRHRQARVPSGAEKDWAHPLRGTSGCVVTQSGDTCSPPKGGTTTVSLASLSGGERASEGFAGRQCREVPTCFPSMGNELKGRRSPDANLCCVHPRPNPGPVT